MSKFEKDTEIFAHLIAKPELFTEATGPDAMVHDKEWAERMARQMFAARVSEKHGHDRIADDDYARIGRMLTDYAVAYAERCVIEEEDGWENQDVSRHGIANGPELPANG